MTSTTETPAAHYRDLAAKFTKRVESVPAERWDDASPCDGWTARDVVRHVIDTQRYIVTVVDLELPEPPSVDEDPVAAWAATRDGMQEILNDPALVSREYDGHFGRTDLGKTIDSFYCFDLVVHGWDLARATGLDETIPAGDLTWVGGVAEQMGESIRTAGVCGPAVDVPADADEQTRVLAFLGRNA
ncbi:TIGR03086 family protein [Rhodococcus sp. IEGM 248]|uniref:TIGR03086 family metal-binding protein n=1 Tax=Rhodococcus opacus TaxID=37919 RepID=UPI0013C23580|nr:TIGR03086 family metal-binding protein [Rhodococcus opacus]MDV7084622.1 TIGR03086 family metal-binding protein [Rhodococcus opacus]NDV04107.1 TIGR03086 family protein [Rhodococcus sp. IEGM 248]